MKQMKRTFYERIPSPNEVSTLPAQSVAQCKVFYFDANGIIKNY